MRNQSPRPFVLAETNWKTVSETEYSVAILPWGATEAHNLHLPYATDNIQVEHIANQAAKIAWDASARTIVLPCVPFGVNTGQMDIKFCLNMNPSTQLALLKDIADVLVAAKISKLVILNGHGGNDFKQMIRELSILYPTLFICSVNWYEAEDPSPYFEDPGNHAGALETSLIMHIASEWVMPLSEAGDGAAKTFKIDGLKKGWAKAQRAWTQVTADTGVGDPAEATCEKGRDYLENCCRKIAGFLVDLAAADLDDMYE